MLEKEEKKPDAATIKTIYEANKEVFTVPDTTSAAHILVKVDRASGEAIVAEKKKLADALKAKVVGKPDAVFAAVAAESSDDPSGKARGGDIGTFKRGDLFPEFEAVAFKLKEGEIAGPVQTDRGFHIIRGGGVAMGRVMPMREASTIIAEACQKLIAARMAADDALYRELGDSLKRAVPSWRASGKNAAPGVANPHGAPTGH